MFCAELAELEARLDDIITTLEDPNITGKEKQALLKTRDELSRSIKDHQLFWA